MQGAGSFDPGPYGVAPETTSVFVVIRVLFWVVLLGGLGLVAWGVYKEEERGVSGG